MTPTAAAPRLAIQVPAAAAAVTAAAKPYRLPLPVKFFLGFIGMTTIFGKGPTYLGVPPLFWAELSLLGLVAWMLLRSGPAPFFLPSPRPLSIAITAYMGLGAVLVAIHAPSGGLDALRDGAIWYYGVFYFAGLYLTRDTQMGDRVWTVLRTAWVLCTIWAFVNFTTGRQLELAPPILPWRGVSLWSNSNSELVQNMTFGSVIILGTSFLKSRYWLRMALLLPAVVVLGYTALDYGRGAKVGIIVGLGAAISLSYAGAKAFRFGRVVLPLLVLGIVGLLFAAAIFELDLARITNMNRFVKDEGTAGWRTLWWGNLYKEVMIENPLFGLGFGRDWWLWNPEIITEEYAAHPVRAPHNFNVTVFSRMGIVGATLWVSILAIGFGGLYRRIWRGGFAPARQEELAFWMAFVLCTWLNSTFGVLMEGPALGVWFWFALGFAWGRTREWRPARALAGGVR